MFRFTNVQLVPGGYYELPSNNMAIALETNRKKHDKGFKCYLMAMPGEVATVPYVSTTITTESPTTPYTNTTCSKYTNLQHLIHGNVTYYQEMLYKICMTAMQKCN